MNRDGRLITAYTAKLVAYNRQQGLSLIELMIGLLIGLILLGGVLQTMLASKEASIARQNMVVITENARFLVDFLGRDLRMAGRGCVDEDPDDVLDCESGDVDTDGILELVDSTLKAAYIEPDGNKVVVEFGHADGVVSYARKVLDLDGTEVSSQGPEPLIDQVEKFDVAFGYSTGGDDISYTSYGSFVEDDEVKDIIALRFKVEFENSGHDGSELAFQAPPIVTTIALRNRVAKVIK
jgi:prepilin-type N-terminal cleavage/methylation domain-containing protein